MVAVRSDSIIESITTKKLRERGILDTARAFGWIAKDFRGANVEQYPIFDPFTGKRIVDRVTVFSDEDKKRLGDTTKKKVPTKYKWVTGKPTDEPKASYTDWYILPPTKQAIADASGVCYLANGEKSVLAFFAGGIYNVIATTHTEIRVPNLDVLKQLGVTTLINIPDNDEAGRRGALKWKEGVKDIEVITLRWDTETLKYDANDLWIECGFDGDLFRNTINNLPKLTLANVDAKPLIQKIDYGTFNTDLVSNIFTALSNHLGLLINRPTSGFSDNFKCMFHDDDNPSAGINGNGVVNCFVCGSHGTKEVAEYFGLEVFTRPTRTRHNAHLSPTDSVQRATLAQPAPQAKIISFDDAFKGYEEQLKGRAWLMSWDYMPQFLHTAYAIINTSDAILIRHIAYLIQEGELSPLSLTVASIATLTRFSDSMVRRLMIRYEGVLWVKNAPVRNGVGRPEQSYHTRPLNQKALMAMVDERLRELLYTDVAPPSDSMASDSLESKEWLNNRYEFLKRDDAKQADMTRDAFIYRLEQCFDELADNPLPAMPAWQQLSVKDYLKAYMTARILEAGKNGLQISQKRFGLELGVCDKTIATYLKSIPVQSKENTVHYQFKKGTTPIAEQVRDALKVKRGRAVSVMLYHGDVFLKSFPYGANHDRTIKKALDEGKVVKLLIQQANSYTHADYCEDVDNLPVVKPAKVSKQKEATNGTPIPDNTSEPQKVAHKNTQKLWIPEIDDNPKRTYTGHWYAKWVLRLANMTLDKDCRAVALSDGTVIFDVVDMNTLQFVAHHFSELIYDYPELNDPEYLGSYKDWLYKDVPF